MPQSPQSPRHCRPTCPYMVALLHGDIVARQHALRGSEATHCVAYPKSDTRIHEEKVHEIVLFGPNRSSLVKFVPLKKKHAAQDSGHCTNPASETSSAEKENEPPLVVACYTRSKYTTMVVKPVKAPREEFNIFQQQ